MKFDIVGFLKDVFLVLIWTTLVWKTAWQQSREAIIDEVTKETNNLLEKTLKDLKKYLEQQNIPPKDE